VCFNWIVFSLTYSEGNAFFKNKTYKQAIEKYTEAIDLDPSDVTFYSNRSACYAALEMWQEAADDGRQCIMTDKSFVKGYFRSALAQQNLGNLDASLDAVKRGLGIDSTSADLKRMSREIEESQRMKKVDSFILSAESQLKSDDVVSAYKTVDAGLRLDPNNRALNKLMDTVRPKYERFEKQRTSSLDPKERIKEEGDKYFKAAKFELAIKSYTRCLDSISDKVRRHPHTHTHTHTHTRIHTHTHTHTHTLQYGICGDAAVFRDDHNIYFIVPRLYT
jgi:tetratricopeptide (TPR) repeat protein